MGCEEMFNAVVQFFDDSKSASGLDIVGDRQLQHTIEILYEVKDALMNQCEEAQQKRRDLRAGIVTGE